MNAHQNKFSKFSMQKMSEVRQISRGACESSLETVNISNELRTRIIADLTSYTKTCLKELNICSSLLTEKDIEAFNHCYEKNPAKNIKGATGYNRLFWLYILCRALNPVVVVESGVYVGSSLWVLRHAVPDAKLKAFDISFKPLTFRDESIDYIESDWSISAVESESKNDFCYFDDHINNCLRIRQAYEKGFKHLVFDDAPSVMNLRHFRYPGVPTAQMLRDDQLREGDIISWQWKDQHLEYEYSTSHEYNVREIIDSITVLPKIKKYTGYDDSDQFVYVRLK